ncbi:30S ribosomal protein S19e [Candidatus Micrarchaeota archaeon]|nr:30S ribosomal protein S19e [Candidatus Micrarchaeota archaeon]MBU1939870.1 30S ribosomal protein S19e [Candidatus Micrarchaeota archaeon]
MLIDEVAKELKGKIEAPQWTDFVKTGVNRNRAPQNPDWYFVRAASILYRVYADGPVGTESLRSYYGGRQRRGVRTEHFRKASGKIIRTCLQALEKEGLIKKVERGKGRTITGKGESYLHGRAKVVAEGFKKIRADENAKEKERAERALKARAEAERKKQALKIAENREQGVAQQGVVQQSTPQKPVPVQAQVDKQKTIQVQKPSEKVAAKPAGKVEVKVEEKVTIKPEEKPKADEKSIGKKEKGE